TGEGKKDEVTGRMSGRARDNRLVHFTPNKNTFPGDLVEVEVTSAAPFHLISDAPIISHRHTTGSLRKPSSAVNLGLPTIQLKS
ncbi:MAG: tRNA (N6-isopentenyl adenosine(37)-C2)-methylthiotransferase MiaB, partial [Candidatus Nanopelagicales bacterium]